MKDVLTIAEVVHFCTKAAAEAHREVFKQSHDGRAADVAAKMAFVVNMPCLENNAAVQAYLACVARGIELHLVSHKEAIRMTAVARSWLAADAASRRAAYRSTANEDHGGNVVVMA